MSRETAVDGQGDAEYETCAGAAQPEHCRGDFLGAFEVRGPEGVSLLIGNLFYLKHSATRVLN